MKPQNQYTLLLHPLFIFSISLLFINDISWKYEYHNWITGKLSDFAGVFALPIFFTAFFPSYKKYIFIFSVLFFIWWKSDLSGSFIHFFNSISSIHIGRVVDYSDLFALTMLLPVYYLKPIEINSRYKRTVFNAMSVFTLFAFCNTSVAPRYLSHSLRENEVTVSYNYQTSKSRDEILEKLDALGLNWRTDSIRYYPASIPHNLYYRVQSKNDSSFKYIPVANTKDSTLYVKYSNERFFIIPMYIIETDTLYNIEFDIYSNNRKRKNTSVYIKSFRVQQEKPERIFVTTSQYRFYERQLEILFTK